MPIDEVPEHLGTVCGFGDRLRRRWSTRSGGHSVFQGTLQSCTCEMPTSGIVGNLLIQAR